MSLFNHLIMLPIIVPMVIAALLLLPPLNQRRQLQRAVAVGAQLLTLVLAILLLVQVNQQGPVAYAVGEWLPPFGIALYADKLAVLLVVLTCFLAFCAHLYALAGDDNRGEFFHPLFLFQVTGINGAFLTGDMFNLFVFFEILLIASYALMVHGGGKARIGANTHYVFLNLLGSALFLIALGALYGSLGTLNMAHMAERAAALPAGHTALVESGALLLLVVFAMKAAILPLYFWLPKTYASATAPVAALFAVLTKVGIYSILRVHGVIFGNGAGELANIALPWLWPVAYATLALGAIAVLASQTLRTLTANLVIVSVGTLLFTILLNNEQAAAAGLYYLIHSTLASAVLFLIADQVKKQRGKAEDRFVFSRKIAQNGLIGGLFFIAALGVIGMPPLSGFIGKMLVLQSAGSHPHAGWIWATILLAGLISLVTLSRAGTTLFWKHTGKPSDESPAQAVEVISIALLLLALPLLTLAAGPITEYTQEAAQQLYQGVHLHDLQSLSGGSK